MFWAEPETKRLWIVTEKDIPFEMGKILGVFNDINRRRTQHGAWYTELKYFNK